MSDLDQVLFAVLVIGALVGMWSYRSVLMRLRDHHSEVWQGLGSPAFPTNHSIAMNLRVRRFLRSEDCAAIADETLSRKIVVHRRLEMAYLAVLLALAARFALRFVFS